MTNVTHISVGAAIGRFIPNPFLAFLVGLLSHLVIDKVPHFWPEKSQNQRKMMFWDALISATLLLLLIIFPVEPKWSILAGAIGGGVVDVFLVIVPTFLIKGFMNNPVRVWHEERQYHHHNSWYLLTDVGITIVALGVFFL